MIEKVARSLRKRASRLLGTPLRPEDLLRRKAIARAYLRGRGLEIGALHNPLKVPPAAHVRYVDKLGDADLRREFPELKDKDLVHVDIVDDGETLATVPDGSQDFVIANHFVEHCENPIGAVGNMLRVLKAGGLLYLAIPDKRYTFDRDRPVTSMEHVRRDYHDGPEWSRRSHYEEWACLVDKIADPAGRERQVESLLARRAAIHFHVWTQAEMVDLVTEMRRLWPFDVELMFKRDNEVLFILRKTAPRRDA